MNSSTLPEIGGNPEGLSDIGVTFNRAISQLGDIGYGISQSGFAPWTGQTNEAFKSKLSDFHPHLSTVSEALNVAAGQVNQFVGKLEGYQTRNNNYHQQYEAKQTQLSNAQSAVQTAARDLAQKTDAHRQSLLTKAAGWIDHEAEVALHDAESVWNDAVKLVDSIEQDISDLVDDAWRDFNDFVHDAEAAASVIVSATEDVGQIFFSAVSSVVNDVGTVASDEWTVVTHPKRDLDDLGNFVDKHWKTIHAVLEYTSMAAGIITAGVLMATGVGAPLGAAIMVGESAAFAGGEVGGDFFVARKSDPYASSRAFAAQSENGDIVNGVEGVGLSAVGADPDLDIGDSLVDHLATGADDAVGDSLDDLSRVTDDGVIQPLSSTLKFGLGATTGLIDTDLPIGLNLVTDAVAPHVGSLLTESERNVDPAPNVPGVSGVLHEMTRFSSPLPE